ncbi:ankyrin repeat [Paramuricea clavata]|uniref:Ankyrin repeat n=1 Tax=Paramuricea clavata TaxID=317549 RepID=A0A7D9L0V3_PARCT|nr:ankyrin repeat [Paramuricea clavata]
MLVLRKESPEEYLDEIRKENAQNSKNCFGIPTLCSAIHKFRSAYLVEELLKDGATVNAFTCMKGLRLNGITRSRYKQWGDYSAIHLAVSLGQHEIVSLLLTHGADLTSKTTKGISSLDFVLDPDIRCEPNEIQITEKDDLEILKIMKNEALDLTRKDHISQSTVLHRAVTRRCLEIVRYLISVGVDVNCIDRTSSTPLHHCTWNNMETLRILLENNANPNAQNELGNTLYHHIFGHYRRKGNENLLPFLHLLHKFNANPNVQNDGGETALHECLKNIQYMHNQIKSVNFMLRQGADPNIKDIFERTPIYHLLFLPNSDMLYLIRSLLTALIQFGARLDHLDIKGTPLLHILVYGQFFHSNQFDAQLWNEILHPKYKVNLNVQDYCNRTVLHFAAAEGDWKFGEVFLKHRGNLDILDCDGNTPLDVAVLCKQWEFAKNVLLWPFVVGQRRDFGGKQASGHIDEDTTKNTISSGNSGCESLLFRSLALANYDNDNNNSNNNNNNNNNINNNSNDDNGNNGNNNNSYNNNNNNSNNSLNFNNQNQRHSGALRQLQKSNSMPSLESKKRGGTSVIPLGSSVKWTKAKLDTIAKHVVIEGNHLYFTTVPLDPLCFWEIDLSPKPKISENFSTQINESSLLRLCEENSLEFHLTKACGEEHCLLAQQVFSLVSDLLTKCSEMDPRMKSKFHWTGSSSEGTKMWLPDEFDFVMELVELQDCCYIDDNLR